LGSVAVAVKDQFGNTVTGDSSTITLTLASGVFSTGSNAVSMQASGGIATFSGLTINANGSYTLAASDGPLTGATSSSFSISSILSIDDSFSDPPAYLESTKGAGVDQVNYSGSGWSTVKGTALVNAFNGTITSSSATNSTATVLFKGVQIAFYAGEKNNRGIAAVSIDGGPETMIDLYANDSTGFCTLVYTSPVLAAGSHTFAVRVTNTKDANSGGTTVSIDRFDIVKGASAIIWPNPGDIVYGTSLDSTQLDATANVPGTFTYSPPAGTVLGAGQGQTLNLSFVPTDSADYLPATASVTINVAKANPVISWPEPAGLLHGQPLTPRQLDATANVPGTFVYNPGLGATLPTRPDNPLSATFTPQDTADYDTVRAGSVIDYFPATPTIVWPNPADISYGTPLGSTQLDAAAMFQNSPVDGTFTYSPPAGTVLGVGQNQTLNVTFTPTDTTDFVDTTGSAEINVDPLTVSTASDSGPGSLRQALLDAEDLPGTTHTIYFQLPVGSQTINLQSPLPTLLDQIFAVLDATQNVAVNSPSSGGADAFGPITKIGAGSLTLAGIDTFNGNLAMHDGRLRLAASSESTLIAGISASIDGTGTLELGGSFSDLSGGGSSAAISNSSAAPVGIEVSGSNQIVGSISGNGNLTIDAGADLTANQIVQGSLVIGGTAGSPDFVTIAPSDASGNPLISGASSNLATAVMQAPVTGASGSPIVPADATFKSNERDASSVGHSAASTLTLAALSAAEWISTSSTPSAYTSAPPVVATPVAPSSVRLSVGLSSIASNGMARLFNFPMRFDGAVSPTDADRAIDEVLASLLADESGDHSSQSWLDSLILFVDTGPKH
jgi:hypothetical protein